jgi:beta-glucosidase/6-phospho-beta-glucosidase/beta-galactosidase
MDEDLRTIRSLGVDLVRYGMPWRLAEPEPGHYDWTMWDRAFAACDTAELEPIVDLLHFGLPDRFAGFADPKPMAEAHGYFDAVDDSVMDRIAALTIRDQLVAGHDFYPTSVQAVGGPAPAWTVEQRVEFGLAELRRWHDRYSVPFWIAETSNLSLPLADQIPWLQSLTDGIYQLRAEGLPARGLCWYSRGDQFDWDTGLHEPVGAITEVGLFDSQRRPRPVVGRFTELAARGVTS